MAPRERSGERAWGANMTLGKRPETELVARAVRGDAEAQASLLQANLESIVRLARERSPGSLPLDDLVQEGSIGLLTAIRTFAASGRSDFTGYARERAAAQMATALEAESEAQRENADLVAAADEYDACEHKLAGELQRLPTQGEMAERLRWAPERVSVIKELVEDARRRHDEELLLYVDPDSVDTSDLDDRRG